MKTTPQASDLVRARALAVALAAALVFGITGCGARAPSPIPDESSGADGRGPSGAHDAAAGVVVLEEEPAPHEAGSPKTGDMPIASGAPGRAAATVDTIVFGDATSEQAHALSLGWGPVTPMSWVGTWTPPSDPSTGAPSDVITGAFGEPARRLLPRTPNPDV